MLHSALQCGVPSWLMSILNSLAEEFSPEVRTRGTDYFVRGAVRITRGEPGQVQAVVQGSRAYKVEIDISETNDQQVSDFVTECSCPYFEQWGECKHIWV